MPLSVYAKITAIFFLTSLLNNKALDFQISIPVHTVFRSSGLCATLLLGHFGYHLRYPRHQVVACLLVSVGILAVTVMDAGKGKRAANNAVVESCCGGEGRAAGANAYGLLNSSDVSGFNSTAANVTTLVGTVTEQLSSNVVWGTGIGMLTSQLAANHGKTCHTQVSYLFSPCVRVCMLLTVAALFLAAYLGHEQDRTYKQYGKSTWKEVMFYSHLFALPAFTFVAPDVLRHLRLLASLPPSDLPLPFLPSLPPLSPPLLLVLLLNLLFQSVCIRGVYLLTTHSNTLTCNLLLTLRKLLSLLLSVTYFGNSFSVWQWCGSVLVFLGVLAYSQNPFGGRETWAAMIKSPAASESTTPERRQRELAGKSAVGVGSVRDGVVGDEVVQQVVEEKAAGSVRRRITAQ